MRSKHERKWIQAADQKGLKGIDRRSFFRLCYWRYQQDQIRHQRFLSQQKEKNRLLRREKDVIMALDDAASKAADEILIHYPKYFVTYLRLRGVSINDIQNLTGLSRDTIYQRIRRERTYLTRKGVPSIIRLAVMAGCSSVSTARTDYAYKK